MTLRRALTGLALCVMAMAFLMACAELSPPPPPPIVEPPPPPAPVVYFVNVSSLALRNGPSASAPQISTLQLNDEVEIKETTGSWARVRDLRRHIVGWASLLYLQPTPASRPRYVPRHRAPTPKEPAPEEPAPVSPVVPRVM